MNISSNLKQLRFMKSAMPAEKKEKETLATWMLLLVQENTKNPNKKEKKT
ncbi:hypothetical protein NEFER03_0635 [Nematocida sp. LUAm3]|nr:hypothetical protein NEFER03_0635 [Nematocida sp. LUAm3]KAI5175111.1 hypothetical protein NEFER02_1072 [Nematocida sp. LUAm2]KAI5178081.1 hypothetical protein NEFER01_1259 [Nematocida sp. LUAm1]